MMKSTNQSRPIAPHSYIPFLHTLHKSPRLQEIISEA
jgi:hypothetical protein